MQTGKSSGQFVNSVFKIRAIRENTRLIARCSFQCITLIGPNVLSKCAKNITCLKPMTFYKNKNSPTSIIQINEVPNLSNEGKVISSIEILKM